MWDAVLYSISNVAYWRHLHNAPDAATSSGFLLLLLPRWPFFDFTVGRKRRKKERKKGHIKQKLKRRDDTE